MNASKKHQSKKSPRALNFSHFLKVISEIQFGLVGLSSRAEGSAGTYVEPRDVEVADKGEEVCNA